MRLTTTTNVSVDGVMQGLGGADEDRRGGFERGGWAIPLLDAETGDYLSEVYGGASGDLATAIAELKADHDVELLVPGSGVLVRWLLANDLVDQLDLLTYPVIVGQGTGGGAPCWTSGAPPGIPSGGQRNATTSACYLLLKLSVSAPAVQVRVSFTNDISMGRLRNCVTHCS